MTPINAKKRATHQSCTLLLIVYYLFLYRNHLTSSKSTASLYEQLAYTCCNYIANPKISIHKQPQLLTTKVRFLFINKEM